METADIVSFILLMISGVYRDQKTTICSKLVGFGIQAICKLDVIFSVFVRQSRIFISWWM